VPAGAEIYLQKETLFVFPLRVKSKVNGGGGINNDAPFKSVKRYRMARNMSMPTSGDFYYGPDSAPAPEWCAGG
jgi:hypothetical protein